MGAASPDCSFSSDHHPTVAVAPQIPVPLSQLAPEHGGTPHVAPQPCPQCRCCAGVSVSGAARAPPGTSAELGCRLGVPEPRSSSCELPPPLSSALINQRVINTQHSLQTAREPLCSLGQLPKRQSLQGHSSSTDLSCCGAVGPRHCCSGGQDGLWV